MVNSVLEEALALVSRQVNDDIIKPSLGSSNISEWCKKEACWTRIQASTEAIANLLSQEFYDQLVSKDNQIATERSAKKTQRIDNGIGAQQKVLAVPSSEWARICQLLLERHLLTPKEEGVLRVAMQIPIKIPTEKQSLVLLEVLDKGLLEGIVVSKS